MKKLFVVFLLAFFAFVFSGYAQNLTVRDIMAEPSIAGMRVEGEKLSPNGTKVVYLWNAEGKMPRDLYLVPTSGGTPTVILRNSDLPEPTRSPQPEIKLNYGIELRDDFVKARENQLGGFEWSPDSKKLVFSYGGDVYALTLGEKTAKRFTKTQLPEVGARFLDNERIMFSQGGNVFVLNTSDSTLTQVTKEANLQTNVAVGNPTPNKAGTMLAYVVLDSSKFRSLVVPNYLPEFVAANPTRRGWSEQKLFLTPPDGSRETPYEIKLPKPEGVSSFRRMVWTADGQSLIVDRVDKDTKRRQLFYVHNVGGKAEQIILVTEETDDKWQASLSVNFEPNPKDPSELFFGSERDGFNHLFLAKLERRKPEANPTGEIRAESGDPGFSSNVTITQLTKGNWQVEWAKWTDDRTIAYASTQTTGPRSSPQEAVAERQLFLYSVETGNIIARVYPQRGMRTGFQMSESAQVPFVLFEGSEWNHPGELYVERMSATAPAQPLRLTQTTPPQFGKINWTVPKFIDIPSRDGKKIPAKIYLPSDHKPNAKIKYPMVIFVHGAGYLQNVINGWNNYYREFMFNDMLTRKGYVVLDIDYRGSAGYGRDWRTDVYDFLGGKDYDDHIDGIDFMVKNYGVNQSKIGVYGGSYGGFMAAMLAARAPDKIAAAAALRPVMDWKNYYAANPSYTAQRLGFPDKNPEAYKRSSPITYADKLERPLLILHGMSDDNVHVQDSVQMIEKLIRLGKTRYFEAMLYPSENHGFVRPESWTDEYERIFAFFEKNLK